MGQRVIATTAVQCVGNTLLVSGRVYSPPFVLVAHRRPRSAAGRRSTPNRAWRSIAAVRGGVRAAARRHRRAMRCTCPAYSGSGSPWYKPSALGRLTEQAHSKGDPRSRRRQLRLVRLQPRAVPRPARRGDAWCAATTRSRRGTSAGLGVDGVLLSPGPKGPWEAGVSVEMVRYCAAERLPLLGVCLGHQAIGVAFGGRCVRAPELLHGKTSMVTHTGEGVLADLPNPVRRHALPLARDRPRRACRTSSP